MTPVTADDEPTFPGLEAQDSTGELEYQRYVAGNCGRYLAHRSSRAGVA